MEFSLEAQPTIQKTTIWDEFVPIKQSKETIDIYLTDNIEQPSNYNQLVYVISNAEPYQDINLYINNNGGYIDSALYILDAMKKTKATVTAHLSGTVASASTIIALSCDKIVCAKYLSFMVHNYSSGISGKGHEMKAYQNFTDRELNRAFKEIYKDFLSEEEMEKVLEGTDLWLNEQEVTERFERKVL